MNGVKWCLYNIKLVIRDIISFFIFIAIIVKTRIFQCKVKGIRILVYHSIMKAPRYKDALRITVPPVLFEKQIRFLLALKYSIVSMDDLLDCVSGVKDMDSKKIVLTFDDGFGDNFDYGYPILKVNRLTAVYFVSTDYIGSGNKFPWYASDSVYGKPLTWEKVSRLSSEGMTIGSHTCSHQNLGDICDSVDKLENELKISRQILENKLNREVRYFAYPFGCKDSYNKVTQDYLKNSGYKAACVNIFGINKRGDNVFELKRTRIDWNDGLFKFRMKLEGAYDWVDKFK